jgi:predicted nuclease with TOPRIM domain
VHQNTSRLQTLEAAQHGTLQALSRTPSSQITEISALKTAQFDLQETIQSLDSEQTELISTQTAVESTLDLQASQLAALATQAAAFQESQDRSQEVIGYLATRQAASASLPFDIHLTQLLLWINRAHQDILHTNYGQAEGEIKQAELRLAQLADQSPGAQQPALNEALTLLSKAAETLPGNPDLAREQLDLAWELLLETVNRTSQPGDSQTPTPTEIRSQPSTPTPNNLTTPSP